MMLAFANNDVPLAGVRREPSSEESCHYDIDDFAARNTQSCQRGSTCGDGPVANCAAAAALMEVQRDPTAAEPYGAGCLKHNGSRSDNMDILLGYIKPRVELINSEIRPPYTCFSHRVACFSC